MRKESQVKEKQKIIADKNKRVFQGITLKTANKNETLAVLAELAGLPIHIGLDESKNNKIEKAAKSAKTANIDVEDCFEGQFPICFLCHKPIPILKTLSSVEGKPSHRSCITSLEAGKN